MSAPQQMIVEVRAQLQWVFYQDQESGRWIAICEPIKATIEADTHAELRENIEHGLNMLFRSLLRDNELDHFLRKRGWSLASKLPSDTDEVRFDVPIELIARKANDTANRVH